MTNLHSFRKQTFWDFFDTEAAPNLRYREVTFRKIFDYLDTKNKPILIVETGCARIPNNWAGDGQSTVLFDKYVSNRDAESICYSVDISQSSVENCRNLVSNRVTVSQDDSVHYLQNLAKKINSEGRYIDLLYLDSFDLDFIYWQPSAIHHLKELCAAMKCIDKNTLVVVDDSPPNADFIWSDEKSITFINTPIIGGKGRMVAEFAQATGAQLYFIGHYQAGWTGF